MPRQYRYSTHSEVSLVLDPLLLYLRLSAGDGPQESEGGGQEGGEEEGAPEEAEGGGVELHPQGSLQEGHGHVQQGRGDVDAELDHVLWAREHRAAESERDRHSLNSKDNPPHQLRLTVSIGTSREGRTPDWTRGAPSGAG